MMSVIRVAFLAAALFAGTCAGTRIFGLNWKCAEWYCKNTNLNIVHIEPYGGTIIDLTTAVQGKSADIEALSTLSAYDPATKTYFVVIQDQTNNVAQLLSLSNATGALTNVSIPYLYNSVNLSRVEYDTVGSRLLGNYGGTLVSLNVKSGAITPVLKLFDDATYYSGQVSSYDSYNGDFIVTIYPQQINDCYYVLSANLATGNVTIGPCLAPPYENPGNWDLVNTFAFNSSTFLTLWQDILGGNLNYYDPVTANVSRAVFSPSDFAAWGWMLGSQDTTTYDPSLQVYWALVNFGDQEQLMMGGIDVKKKVGIPGGTLNTVELRSLRLMY
eukprot:TRINITY_DN31066_c0_g1_i1.p1 TRINITY_DN31066_c0_g1~~TRINITY_DN31066_c0_g1_i1.p1  ORF type:complete len:347 (-),score=106.58 TRINITY_DN31066_c0_g1_i1:296-1282(-)